MEKVRKPAQTAPQGRRNKIRKSQQRVPEKFAPRPVPSSSPGPVSPGATRLILVAATIICLLPFIGKPFNIDDPLFVWTAKQIVHQPLDPYGFSVVWYTTEMPMFHVTKNPPLASYYAAMIGPWTNWSEVALHLGFLIPALVVVLGTYELARKLTKRPLLAAGLTLAAPGFLVSSTSVMSDIPMLALWLVCVLAWRKGLSSGRARYLVLSALLIGVCALTKYFGACLIPLLFAYSIFKQRRLGYWSLSLLITVIILICYQLWGLHQYDEGLLSSAVEYAQVVRAEIAPSTLGGLLTGLSFTGGCMLPVLLMVPFLFRRLAIAMGFLLAVPGAILIEWNILGKYSDAPGKIWVCVTLVLLIAGGIFTVALAARLDFWRRRDADSLLLNAWAMGTFVFAAILNWTVNARSVLPLIPAAAILVARRMDTLESNRKGAPWIIALPVAASLTVSLWLASADSAMAYSAREAARLIHLRAETRSSKVFFSGHWGFQYYMENLGAQPLDFTKRNVTPDDMLVFPENNSNPVLLPKEGITLDSPIEIDVNRWIYPLNPHMGAGFYSSIFGPLPFAFGRVPPEKYTLFHLN